jgi:hypothetical protein
MDGKKMVEACGNAGRRFGEEINRELELLRKACRTPSRISADFERSMLAISDSVGMSPELVKKLQSKVKEFGK